MKLIPDGSQRSAKESAEALLERRTLLGAACAGAVATVLPGALRAQSAYPSKAITLIVPNPPGGNTDILARIFSVPLAKAPWWWTTVQAPVA